jgi:hypothetical protein
MLFSGKKVAVYFDSHTIFVNTLCARNEDFFWDSSVGIATGYGLDDHGGGEFESR